MPGDTSLESRLLSVLKAINQEDLDLSRLARRQGVARHLSDFSSCSPKLSRDESLQQLAFSMQMVSSLGQVLTLLEEASVPCLTFKGPTLSKLIYGEPFLRSYGDLDLMVHPRDLERAREVLEAHGFRSAFLSYSTAAQWEAHRRFAKALTLERDDRLTLDLHWKLLSQWVAVELPFDQLWAQRQLVALSPDLSAPTLGNEHLLVFLCFHGSQDGWTSLKQLLDLALALNNLPYCSQELYRIAGVRRPLLERSISLAVEILGAQPPDGHRPYFSGYQEALHFLLATHRQAEPPQLALLKPELWEGLSVGALLSSIKAILTPANDDILAAELPHWAINGYVLVRAARLLQKLLQRRRLK